MPLKLADTRLLVSALPAQSIFLPMVALLLVLCYHKSDSRGGKDFWCKVKNEKENLIIDLRGAKWI